VPLCLVLAVILGTAVAEPWSEGADPWLVVACYSFVADIVLSLVHPATSIATFVFFLLVRPWEFLKEAHVIAMLPKLLAILSLATFATSRVRLRQHFVILPRPFIHLLVFVGWLAVVAILSSDPLGELTFLYQSFAPTIVLCFLLHNVVRNDEGLALILNSVSIAVSTVAAASIIVTYFAVSSDPHASERLYSAGLYSNPNDLAALIVVGVASTVSPISPAPLRNWLVRAVTVLFLLVTLWLTQSRGAILAVMVGSGAIIIGWYRLTPRTLALLCGFGLVAIVGMRSLQRDSGDLEGSRDSRMNYVVAGMRMARSSPIFGVGLDQYPKRYEQFTSDFSEWGERTAHSSWILALAETGVPGFLIFSTLYGRSLWHSWRARRTKPQLLLVMVSYGVAMSFLSHTYLTLPFLLMTLAIAATRIEAASSPTSTVLGPR
jgi:O-antigen ligase